MADTYVIRLDVRTMSIDDLIGYAELVEMMTGWSEQQNMAQMAAALRRMKEFLAPFVVRADGSPVSTDEALAYLGRLRFGDLSEALRAMGEVSDQAVPPPSDAA